MLGCLRVMCIITIATFFLSAPLALAADHPNSFQEERATLNALSNIVDTAAEQEVLVSAGGADLFTRPMTGRDIRDLKESLGVYEAGKDYDRVVQGRFHTGYAPPTEEEYREMLSTTGVITNYAGTRALNSSVDHTESIYFPPVGGQGAKGSCVAFSMVYYVKTFQEAKEHDWDLSDCDWNGGYYGEPEEEYWGKIMSPDFVYTQMNRGSDGGVGFGAVAQMIDKMGCASYETMPYNHYNYSYWPSEDAFREAPWYRGGSEYYWIKMKDHNTVEPLKAWLDNGNLAAIAINADNYTDLTINDLWKNDTYPGTGTNHANAVVGFDDDFGPYNEDGEVRYGAFKIANTWSTVWSGDSNHDGYYYISYECMKTRIKQAYVYGDRIDYEPKLISVFNASHMKRKECRIYVGMGNASEPLYEKAFNDWGGGSHGGDHPFPENEMVLDISEFIVNETDPYGQPFFLRADDRNTETVGNITYFSLEHFRNYSSQIPINEVVSTDPQVQTVHNTPVYACLYFNDTTRPLLDASSTPKVATTGDGFSFAANASDSVGLGSVYVTYGFGQGGPVENATMSLDVEEHVYDINIGHSLEPLWYTIGAFDIYGNHDSTGVIEVPVLDNDLPGFSDASVPQSLGTGNFQSVSITASDNIDVAAVQFIHSFEEITAVLNLTGSGTYSAEFSAPAFSGEAAGYFLVNDTSGNVNTTDLFTITIIDDDAPVFLKDWSNTTAYAGRPFNFRVNITDNVAVTGAEVEFRYGGGKLWKMPMANIQEDSWQLVIAANNTLEDMLYTFRAVDADGNAAVSQQALVKVKDVDRPRLVRDETDGIATTGDPFFFSVACTDNVGVDSVRAEFTIEGGEEKIAYLLRSGGGNWEGKVTIPDITGDLGYTLLIEDGSGNLLVVEDNWVEIIDNDAPVANAGRDLKCLVGDVVTLDGSKSHDNIGIADLTWVFSIGGSESFRYGSLAEVLFDEPGEYMVRLIAVDDAGLEGVDIVWVNVTAEQQDEPGPGADDDEDEETDDDAFIDDGPEEPGADDEDGSDSEDRTFFVLLVSCIGVLLLLLVVILLIAFLRRRDGGGVVEEEEPVRTAQVMEVDLVEGDSGEEEIVQAEFAPEEGGVADAFESMVEIKEGGSAFEPDEVEDLVPASRGGPETFWSLEDDEEEVGPDF